MDSSEIHALGKPQAHGKSYMGTVELAICEEERFWTEQLTIGLRTLEVAVALQAADAALRLHRFIWTKDRAGFRVSVVGTSAG